MASVHEDSISLRPLAGVGGRRTVNLGKLQVFRVLNFIRFKCVIVKVKSREMTALSKSNVEKIRTARDKRKTGSGHKPCGKPAGRGRLSCSLQTLPSEKQISFPVIYLENSILCYVPRISFFKKSFHDQGLDLVLEDGVL